MIEVLKQMIEALKDITRLLQGITGGTFSKLDAAIQSGRQAIAELESQEPIYQYQLASGAWIDQTKESHDYNVRHGQATVRVLYTYPPQRTWIGLTDEEVKNYWDWEDFQCGCGRRTLLAMVRNIEAKLKEKNT